MGRLRDLMGKKRMFVFALTALALPRSRRGSGGDRLQRRGRDRHPLSAVPTKNALIAELVRDLLKDVVAPAHQAQQAPDGQGLERFIYAMGEVQTENRGCRARIWTDDTSPALRDQYRASLIALLKDARHIT